MQTPSSLSIYLFFFVYFKYFVNRYTYNITYKIIKYNILPKKSHLFSKLFDLYCILEKFLLVSRIQQIYKYMGAHGKFQSWRDTRGGGGGGGKIVSTRLVAYIYIYVYIKMYILILPRDTFIENRSMQSLTKHSPGSPCYPNDTIFGHGNAIPPRTERK